MQTHPDTVMIIHVPKPVCETGAASLLVVG